MKPTRSDDSVQFSLGALMKLEDERVQGEAAERAAREQALVQAKAEEARRAQADAEAKARAEAQANEQRRKAELDAIAEREALQRAKIEQTRLEVDARTRADERERERRHELELSAARSAQPKPTGLGALLGATGLGGGLMMIVACVLHFGVNQPANERRFAELELRAGTAEQRASDSDRKVEEQRKQIASLEKSKSALESTVQDLRTAANAPKSSKVDPTIRHNAPPPGPKPIEKKEADCDEKHDPMCFGKTH